MVDGVPLIIASILLKFLNYHLLVYELAPNFLVLKLEFSLLLNVLASGLKFRLHEMYG